MRLIGYWMQDLLDKDLPLPQEVVGVMPESFRDAVCLYLRSGRLFEAYCGTSWCRFRCGAEDHELGYREFTDGEWIWPEGLAHYVAKHNVILPQEFILCTASNHVIDISNISRKASLDFWIEWTGQRRSTSIRSRLEEALAGARASEPLIVRSKIQDVLAHRKEGLEKCIWAGCSNRALVGLAICARHTLSDDELRLFTSHLYRIPDVI